MRRRTLFTALMALALAWMTLTASPAAADPDPGPPAGPHALAAASADSYVAGHAATFRMSRHDRTVRVKVQSGTNGLQYVAYQRTHRGLPVVGGDFVVVTDAAGRVLDTTVAQDTVIDVGTDPTVSAERARETSRAQLDRVDSVSRPRLVVLAWGDPRLAWETVVTGASATAPSRLHVFVDAISGEVTESYDEVVAGSGNGYYNGNVTISTSASGSGYAMSDPTRPGIRCGGQNGATYTGSDDNWGNGSGTSLETACVDVLYAVQNQWDMLGDWLGRSGIDGDGGGFPARVGLNQVNAYWNGSYTNFGHSSDNQRQATPIDVVAHEFGHAIFSTTPGGASSWQDNGLNESAGDIYGAAVEHYADNPNDSPDYEVGEEVDLVGNGPIRIMYDPSQRDDPNCYTSSVPDMEVHAAAGVQNHWFYLAAEGSNPTNGQPNSPTCNGSTVTGIGVEKALQVYYNAMLRKTSTWSHFDVRVDTLTAAKNLFTGCTEFNRIKAAWDAVDVPQQQGEPTCTVTGPDFSLSVSPSSGSVDPGGSTTATVSTATVSGDPQVVSLSASGVPSGVSVVFDPSSVTSGGSSQMTVSASSSVSAGTYQITVTGSGASVSHSDTFALTVNGAPGCAGSNPTDVAISDNATVQSQVTISGCDGDASAGSAVEVHIVHTYVGDLVVDLVAPDGSVYGLHDREGGSGNDIDRTYTVNLSAEPADGTWTLRVSDRAANDVGRIDSWGLDLAATGDPGGCAGHETTKTGTLSSGQTDVQPDGSYFYTGNSGTHAACLDGPDGADFDLYLQKWTGSSWQTVDRSISSGPDESIAYDGTAGYYRYLVDAYSGSGSYTLGYDTP